MSQNIGGDCERLRNAIETLDAGLVVTPYGDPGWWSPELGGLEALMDYGLIPDMTVQCSWSGCWTIAPNNHCGSRSEARCWADFFDGIQDGSGRVGIGCAGASLIPGPHAITTVPCATGAEFVAVASGTVDALIRCISVPVANDLGVGDCLTSAADAAFDGATGPGSPAVREIWVAKGQDGWVFDLATNSVTAVKAWSDEVEAWMNPRTRRSDPDGYRGDTICRDFQNATTGCGGDYYG